MADVKEKKNADEAKVDPSMVAGENPTAASLLDSTPAPVNRVKLKGAKNIPIGIVHVTSSFNNTVVSITDLKGNVIGWSTAGRSGFKGSRKSTPFAARLATEQTMKTAQSMGVQEVELYIKGPGPGREAAIRAIQSMGVKITKIDDVTPVPHNGCRPPKRRRV